VFNVPRIYSGGSAALSAVNTKDKSMLTVNSTVHLLVAFIIRITLAAAAAATTTTTAAAAATTAAIVFLAVTAITDLLAIPPFDPFALLVLAATYYTLLLLLVATYCALLNVVRIQVHLIIRVTLIFSRLRLRILTLCWCRWLWR
jgi:hypothetical protein